MENRNFINGIFLKSISKKNIPIINPANQNLVGHIDEALDEEINLAYESAKKAFKKRILVDMDSKIKSMMMRSIANKLREKKIEGGKVLSQENGKTVAQCISEFEFAADTFDFYAGLTDKIENKLIPSGIDTLNYVVLEPFGVSLQIVPWNYPVTIFAVMVAQNLIVGNTIVIKPPELCPLSSNSNPFFKSNKTKVTPLPLYGREMIFPPHKFFDVTSFLKLKNTGEPSSAPKSFALTI